MDKSASKAVREVSPRYLVVSEFGSLRGANEARLGGGTYSEERNAIDAAPTEAVDTEVSSDH
jgi:hypothetical protein